MKTNHFKRWINDIINPGGKRLPVRNEVSEASRPTEINRQLLMNSGGEEIPVGGWRGGEEIPVGGWRGGEEIPVGGWRASYPLVFDVYRTEDGLHYFEFYFYWTGSYFEIDIFNMPSYNGRDENLHATHRLPSDRGGYRICFGDPYEVDNMNKARKWAGIWSELTANYITNGEIFPNN